MPEMHLRQLGFAYSVGWPFTKNKKRIQKFKERGDSRYTFQKEYFIQKLVFNMTWLIEILNI